MKKLIVCSMVVCLALFAAQVNAKKKKKKKAEESQKQTTTQPLEGSTAQPKSEEAKESKAVGVPYVYTGPDTGFGVGASGLFRDIGDKEGRYLTFTAQYTINQYNSYSIEWQEPGLFGKSGWGRIYVGYDAKPSRLFYGIGNDSSKESASSFGNTDIDLEPRYDYWFMNKPDKRIGLKVNWRYYYFDPKDGPKIDEDKLQTLSQRRISTVFPGFYHSDQFSTGEVSGFGVDFIYDDRKDKYPMGGGRDEVVYPYFGGRQEFYYAAYNTALGSDFNYTNWSANLSYYLPIGWEWTVLALHGAINIKDGDVPWWDMNSFGSGGSEGGTNTLRGYHDGRFRDNDLIIFNAELRQHFPVEITPLPFWILKQFKLRAPGVALFYDYGRVYDKESQIVGNFDGFHWTCGIGFRFIISPSVVVRADYAVSNEESDFYLTTGWPF
jgi:outer membrane protein assembly factor BamA